MQIRSLQKPLYDEKIHHVCQHVESHLHPFISSGHVPTTTSADGNCLWHMISIGICGHEQLTPHLRLITLLTLLDNEAYFQDLICCDQNPQRTFYRVLRAAATWGAWGDEYHLHALAIALNACICVYNNFLLPDGHFPYMECNGQELAALFLTGAEYTWQSGPSKQDASWLPWEFSLHSHITKI